MTQLTQKYKPSKLGDFAGLSRPRAILSRFVADPGASAWLFLGPSGVGKTTTALAVAAQIGGEIHHIPSKSCDLATVNSIVEKCHYYPWSGKFHFVLVDEADQMSRAAQLAFLSKLDSTAAPPNTVFIFTANSTELLEDRFLSRCRTVSFEKPDTATIEAFLAGVWWAESSLPLPDLADICYQSRGNLRSALMLLEMELLAPTPVVASVPMPPIEPVPVAPPPIPVPPKRLRNWTDSLFAEPMPRETA